MRDGIPDWSDKITAKILKLRKKGLISFASKLHPKMSRLLAVGDRIHLSSLIKPTKKGKEN